MASEPIRSTAVTAAPKDYSIPNAQQIRLLSVTAEFIDNGATGDWLPAVVILDNNGNALCRAVDQGVKVTAGGDAEVSWFPGVSVGGGTGATIAWGRLVGSATPQPVPGDPTGFSPVDVDFTGGGLSEDGSGVFFFDPLVPTLLQCSIAPTPGMFFVQAKIQHDDGTPTGVDPSLVRIFLRFTAPIGGGDAPLHSQTLLGSTNTPPFDVNDLYQWGASGMQDAEGPPTPVGFGIQLMNLSAAMADLESVAPQLMVTLVAA